MTVQVGTLRIGVVRWRLVVLAVISRIDMHGALIALAWAGRRGREVRVLRPHLRRERSRLPARREYLGLQKPSPPRPGSGKR